MSKQPDIWQALSGTLPTAAFMVEWQKRFGADLDTARRFLLPTGMATHWPCPDCPEPHELRPAANGVYVAVPPDESCEKVHLNKAAIMLYRFDLAQFIEDISSALSLTGAPAPLTGNSRTWNIGYASTSSGATIPVFLCIQPTSTNLDTAYALICREISGTCCILVPSAQGVLPTFRQTVARDGHRFFSLADLLRPSSSGTWSNLVTPSVLSGDNAIDTQDRPYVFEHHAAGWRIVYDHSEDMFLKQGLLGALYLKHLLHHPGAVIHALDLESMVDARKAFRSRKNNSKGSEKDEASRLISEKKRLITEAEVMREQGRMIEANETDSDIEKIEEAIRGALRNTTDDGERARNNVRKAIDAAFRALARFPHSKHFLSHLKQHLSRGYELQYNPPQGVTWH